MATLIGVCWLPELRGGRVARPCIQVAGARRTRAFGPQASRHVSGVSPRTGARGR